MKPSERRRKYFQETVEEATLLFNIPRDEAVIFTERFVTFMCEKVRVGDEIKFGDGCISPKTLPPRAFSLITGGGASVSSRKRTFYGERRVWKMKLFKRSKGPKA